MLVEAFCDAFNRNDLDAVMAFFADDGAYTTLEGRRCVGPAAIRAELAPQFAGALGHMHFATEDLFVDEAAGKVVLRWWCEHRIDGFESLRAFGARLLYGRALKWQGLDVLTVVDGKIREKHTYCRAKTPLLTRARARS